MSGALRVLVAEPDAPTRAGLRLALEEAGFEICGEPAGGREALDDAVRERPHLCLLDERLSGGVVLAVDAIARSVPETKVVVLTQSDEPDSLLAALRAGAVGFVRIDLDPARLPAILRGVAAGEAALSRRLTTRVLVSLRTRERGRSAPTKPGGPSMTDRELEVLELMTEGLRTSEIAARLGIAAGTVRRHVSSAVAKLGVADRAAAIRVLSGSSRA